MRKRPVKPYRAILKQISGRTIILENRRIDIYINTGDSIEPTKQIRFSDLQVAAKECAEIALSATFFPSPFPVKIGIQVAASKSSHLLYTNRYSETDQHLIVPRMGKGNWDIVNLKRAACDFKYIITIDRWCNSRVPLMSEKNIQYPASKKPQQIKKYWHNP